MFDASENDLRFAIQHALGPEIHKLISEIHDISNDTVDAVLSEAAKFARDIIAPLNLSGDTEGCTWHPDNTVQTPTGFKEAYNEMCEAGWCSIEASEEFGGQNLSKIISAATAEMWHSANMSFSLCHLLSQGQIHALEKYGNSEQKLTYLPNLINGSWTGTMNLTEPHAGTDLGSLKSTAYPENDHYLVKGQKIYITYGEHDMSENIIHLVLARVEGAPEGIKGISLFIVPKYLVNPDGSLDEKNDVKCLSIEHKLGINGSPTTVLQFGENRGAIGYLVGEENQGLSIMFAMMNDARFGVGVQGLSISNRAFHQAKSYAAERVQGIPLGRKEGDKIHHHPDVMRMLASMRSEIEAMRGIMFYTAATIDLAKSDYDENNNWLRRSELMIPIMKGWLTERSVSIASDGIQIHGGMGFIEETGAAQHYRDARILPIYEGTTAIQANDLLHRKILRDEGTNVLNLINDILEEAKITNKTNSDLKPSSNRIADAAYLTIDTIKFIVDNKKSLRNLSAVSVPILMMMGTLCGAWMALRSAKSASELGNNANWSHNFLNAKLSYVNIFTSHSLPNIQKYSQIIRTGGEAVESLSPEMLWE
ncbi:acyl-CoA dehydrogenase [Amylibacter sp.]|nr:acyl-CoA dehydrogenase [Amylibacter sp.]